MKQNSYQLYSFLKAVRGCWHNAMFIACEHETCSHGHPSPCGGFLLTADADSRPILFPVKTLEKITGESIEPEECQAMIGAQTFKTVYSLYIEWHVTSSTDCPLCQLCHDCKGELYEPQNFLHCCRTPRNQKR